MAGLAYIRASRVGLVSAVLVSFFDVFCHVAITKMSRKSYEWLCYLFGILGSQKVGLSLCFRVPVEDTPVELKLPWTGPGRWGSSPGFLPDLASGVC